MNPRFIMNHEDIKECCRGKVGEGQKDLATGEGEGKNKKKKSTTCQKENVNLLKKKSNFKNFQHKKKNTQKEKMGG